MSESLARDIENLTQQLIASLRPQTESYAWAIQLAEVLNQTDPCPKCEGRGTHNRHLRCAHADSYVWGCYEQVPCGQCHMCGRVPKGNHAKKN